MHDMTLNPLSFHGRTLIEYKKKQAIWFKTCSLSHKLFCNCGDWQIHIQRYCSRQQCIIGGDLTDEGGISFITESGDTADSGGELIGGGATTGDVE
uniref:ORF2 n=1 Tax=Giant panda anellovirus TaxID=2016460 RepID=A0A220IGI1_9VIRU|nr:ORF2 [Giant panda anellovirus]